MARKNLALSKDDPVEMRLAWALSHPRRARIFTVLQQEPASPKDVASRVGGSLSNISYHFRVLRQLALIEVIRQEAVRGSIKTTYQAVPADVLEKQKKAGVLLDIDALAHDAAEAGELREIGRSLRGAVDAGTFGANSRKHIATLTVSLDDAGWTEVLEAIRGLQGAISTAKKRSSRRSAGKDGRTRRPTTISILSYLASAD